MYFSGEVDLEMSFRGELDLDNSFRGEVDPDMFFMGEVDLDMFLHKPPSFILSQTVFPFTTLYAECETRKSTISS